MNGYLYVSALDLSPCVVELTGNYIFLRTDREMDFELFSLLTLQKKTYVVSPLSGFRVRTATYQYWLGNGYIELEGFDHTRLTFGKEGHWERPRWSSYPHKISKLELYRREQE